MGYERDKVEKAVKAANGSIDLAVEFLNSGNIPGAPQQSSNTGNANVNPNLPDELKKNASIIKCLCLNLVLLNVYVLIILKNYLQF